MPDTTLKTPRASQRDAAQTAKTPSLAPSDFQRLNNAAISAAILTRTQAGIPIRLAIDEVLGAGTFQRLTDDLYNALRNRAA